MIDVTTTEPINRAATSTATGALHTVQKSLNDAGHIIGLPENIDFPLTIARIIRVAMGFVGIILLLLILKAGFMWMTSGGDDEKVKEARKTLINAIIGLFLMLSAYSIANGAINAFLPK